MSKDIQAEILKDDLVTRLPLLAHERPYKSFLSFLSTYTSYQAATWVFMVGAFLPFVGNTLVGILTFLAGTLIAEVFVTLSIGPAATRYGVDTGDVSKPTFGPAGTWIAIAVVVVTFLGWSYLVMSLTGRAIAGVYREIVGAESSNEGLVAAACIVTLFIVWLIVVKGPTVFARANRFIAPGLIVLSLIFLATIFSKYGLKALTTNVAPSDAFSENKWTNYLYGYEFGMAYGFATWVPVGGLCRLVRKQKHLIGPSVLGAGAIGGGYLCGVAALGAAVTGETDPTIWLTTVGGSFLGVVFLLFIIGANIPTLSIMIYLTGVATQQSVVARVPWKILVAVLLLPGVLVAFFTEWALAQVAPFLTYTGVIAVGIVGTTLVDYYILRRQQLDVRSMFTRSPMGKYYFWHNVNWVAVFVIVVVTAFDLWLYNPNSMATKPLFNYVGSTLPTLALAVVLYYALMRLIAIPLGKGSYDRYSSRSAREPLTRPVPDAEITF